MAGESAEDVARRAREKAERLIKRAEAFEKGATGERLVAEALKQLPPDWFVLNDRRWPGRSRANIDHVVVGPSGVYVIDAKNWSGRLAVKDGVLRQNGYSRMNAVDGALESAKAVAALFDWMSPGYFLPVLCFVGEAKVDATINGVAICSLEGLPRLLQSRPPVLPPETLQFLRFDLDMSTGSAVGGEPFSPPLGARLPTVNGGASNSAQPSSRPVVPRTPRLARFALAFLWFFLGSVVLSLALPAAHVPADVQGGLGFALLIGCVIYFFRKR
ncbi:nuclease-related domain-containing protein [Nocardioides sp.]|uniref:nuclease-related domain-containing protein n=1 Tax=Nocardioides sp. TaxID=35761 RepID=UPI002CBACFD9|nr:nuclease-related domain-containing protein [Nocardioides sp.]HSX66177.1 nuclease-related domain-containing protein [Nocardioides sp.]